MRGLPFAILLAAMATSGDAATLVLKRAWIEKFKDRATIDASFTIDHAHPRPNAGADDGDMHVAGRAPKEIGLPMVAELMNAIETPMVTKVIHDNEGNGKSLPVAGAWRVWFEHPPSSVAQVQFAVVPPAGNTNPDHCFEIHPLTKLNGVDVTSTLHSIAGFTPKDPAAAFAAYEKLSLSLRVNQTAVTLDSKKVGFNYVRFTMKTMGRRTILKDGGLAVVADVLPDDGEEDDAIAHNVRMIFIPGSEPFKRAQTLAVGEELHVLGIPRLNLNAISTFIRAAGSTAVTRKLPYEMIIVALEAEEE